MVGRSILILMLATLALSGCTSDDPDAQGLDSTDAGTDGAATSTDAGKADAADAVPVSLVQQSFSWDGNLGTLVGACHPMGCQFHGAGEWDNTRTLSGLDAVSLTITWDETTTPELGFGLALPCDGRCDFVELAWGAPPLTVDPSDLDAGQEYELVVFYPYRCPPTGCTAGFQGGVETPFKVEGTLTLQAS